MATIDYNTTIQSIRSIRKNTCKQIKFANYERPRLFFTNEEWDSLLENEDAFFSGMKIHAHICDNDFLWVRWNSATHSYTLKAIAQASKVPQNTITYRKMVLKAEPMTTEEISLDMDTPALLAKDEKRLPELVTQVTELEDEDDYNDDWESTVTTVMKQMVFEIPEGTYVMQIVENLWQQLVDQCSSKSGLTTVSSVGDVITVQWTDGDSEYIITCDSDDNFQKLERVAQESGECIVLLENTLEPEPVHVLEEVVPRHSDALSEAYGRLSNSDKNRTLNELLLSVFSSHLNRSSGHAS